ncbi:MAG: aminoacetone oxidase family FAD-binding enzyme, partial [Planctomycetota bacterium]|nr:aminoacetone oxidase family FAD-binding enzyme [Planctomycetota bacterium]
MPNDQLTVIVGAGAAGLMAAIWARRAGQQVVVLESKSEAAKKILISGGGRCNLLPSIIDSGDFYSNSSSAVINRLFRTWPLEQVHMFFEYELNVPLQLEVETGKYFPVAQKSKVVRDSLQQELVNSGGEILFNQQVTKIQKQDNRFLVCSESQKWMASKVVIATGGKSVPNTGSDGFGYELARQLGHSNIANYPALVPLTSNQILFTQLAGVSLNVEWRCVRNGKVLEVGVNDLLFTHQGFSGPAILDASHWVIRDNAELLVNFSKREISYWLDLFIECPATSSLKLISADVPARLAKAILDSLNIDQQQRAGNLNKLQRKQLAAALCSFKLEVSGNRGFAVAEVTGGGIPLDEINLST